MSERQGIDPRGPRFTATITAVLLLLTLPLALTGLPTMKGLYGEFLLPIASVGRRALDPAFFGLLIVTLLFLWGVLSPRTAPWGVIFREWVAPKLKPPTELEDPRPPRFAQGVGLVVGALGLILQLVGVPWALPIAVMIAFVAAFLNAVFGLCLGCQMYLLLQRAGLVGRAA